MRDAGARAIGEEARGTARLIVTTTPGVTMTVLAQEDLVDAIAAALAREAAEAALWRKNLEDAQSDLAGEVEAHRLEREARVRAEGERDAAVRIGLRILTSGCETHDDEISTLTFGEFLDKYPPACGPCSQQRLAALEAALRGARQRVDEYDNRLCWCRHLRMFADSLHDHGCRSARAALAPPERSRVAAAPEPPGADDTPRGA